MIQISNLPMDPVQTELCMKTKHNTFHKSGIFHSHKLEFK